MRSPSLGARPARCLAAASLGVLVPGVAAEPPQPVLQQLPTEQLANIVGLELQNEDRSPAAPLLSFYEFQDVNELDCPSRLVYLVNETINVRERIQRRHQDMLGVSGLYMQLLEAVPQENSWIWILLRSNDRFLEQVHTYWSKVSALALDRHQCLVTRVRDVMLGAVVRWKGLYADYTAMQWDGFAFGGFGRTDAAEGMRGGKALAETLAASDAFVVSLRQWFDTYTRDLTSAAIAVEEETRGLEDGGATRLHHQDEHGSFVTYEFLRRKVFGQWAIDRGLMRGLIRHVWKPRHDGDPVSLADFGAGGGHYSAWLNDTGLVRAFAFDGTHQAAELTDGRVQEVNLVEDMQLWRNFSWVMCLEVGEHIPKQFSSGLLRNLRRHAQEGLVMSWSDDWEGIGHVNCLSRTEFIAKVEAETGLVLDKVATEAVKASCEIDYIARTIAVFRAPA